MGDITRKTFKPEKHFSSVRMQQGRVQLDADWNELNDIIRHRQRLSMRDIIGPAGGPSDFAGFRITMSAGSLSELVDERDFYILDGRYYVEGIQCQNDTITTLRTQADRRALEDEDIILPGDVGETRYYLVYLDVWERHITATEDSSLLEVALGGADTTTRTKVIWQVRCYSKEGWVTDNDIDLSLIEKKDLIRTTSGTMEAVIPDGQLENRLYRVEVHRSGTLGNSGADVPTFKWSRDNGAIVSRLSEAKLVVAGTAEEHWSFTIKGRADSYNSGDWVEIITEANALESKPGLWARITAEPQENKLEVSVWSRNGDGEWVMTNSLFDDSILDSGELVRLRCWGGSEDIPPEYEMSATFGQTVVDDNIDVKFSNSDTYRTGDYWHIPVRTRQDREIQTDPLKPDGIHHDIAYLALVKLETNLGGDDTLTVERDLRQRYVAPGEELGLVYGGGDGQVSPRGETLPDPLRVYVAGYQGVSGVIVRFSLTGIGTGDLSTDHTMSNPADQIDFRLEDLDFDGLAQCYWRPDGGGVQGDAGSVCAELLDENGHQVGDKLIFNAWFSNADRVRFYQSERAEEARNDPNHEASVQEALDNLYDNAAILHYVGGDGQSGRDGQPLANKLRVRLGDGTWNTNGATVHFEPATDSGSVDATNPTPDTSGVYECTWTLGSAQTQEVLAYVTFAERPGIQVSPLRFTAVLNEAADVGYQNPEHNDSVDTVHDALDDLYDEAVRLHYVDGDGQVAARDEWLPRPLVVALSGYQAPAGKIVRFKLDSSNVWGALSDDGATPDPGGTLDIPVGANGLATCYWRPLDHSGTPGADSTSAEIPAVKAILLDGALETSRQVTFNAWLSNADRLRFYQSERAKEARSDASVEASVQEALDNLYNNAAILHYVGGDGQSAGPTEMLAVPLQVRVANGDWHGPSEPKVHFEVTAGSGSLTAGGVSGADVDGERIGDLHQCRWTLGAAGSQAVKAYVYFDDDLGTKSTPIDFHARLRPVALTHAKGDGQVAYRGDALSLEIALAGYDSLAGKSVVFALPNATSTGLLHDPAGGSSGWTMSVATDVNGMARCTWEPLDHASGDSPAKDSTDVSIPPVTARFTDESNTVHEVLFRASLAHGDRTRFYQSERAKEARNDANPDASVQEALDNLYDNAAILHYVGGDGQSGRAGQPLANKLRVRLGDGTWNTSAATVHFEPAADSGTVDATNPTPDASGVYEYTWTLGSAETQEVLAYVTFAERSGIQVSPLRFTAVLDNAGDAGYQNPEHNDSVDTVQDALDDLYDAAVRLHYVDGDGQVAARDEWLPRPLVVALSGYQAPAGKSVRFKLDSSNVWGALSVDGVTPVPGGTLDVSVGANGLATCYWRPLDHSGTPGADSTSAEIPAVKAILLDGGVETSRQVTFNAWLSNADRLRFYQSERAKEARSDASVEASVQEALDNLYDNTAILHYVGGDGQSGRAGQPLANKLRVRLGDGTWNTSAATVHFEPAADSGTVDATNPTPDASGVYECTWTLGSAETQEVLAYVTFAERSGIQVSPLRFTAVLDNAGDAGYQNPEHNASVDTVHDALDDLYDAAVRLHYVDGDGQVAARDEWLPRPLVVALSGYQAPAGKSVRFKLDSSNVWGALSVDGVTPAPGGTLDVPVGANGLATCYWRPLDHSGTPGADSTSAEIPAVKAILLDGTAETSRQVTFNAWLSNADRLRFYQSERAKEARNDTSAEASVQEALDNLYDNAAILHYVGGDSQSGRTGQPLANKLRVRLGDGTWNTNAATVHFEPAANSGTVDATNPTPDASGVYECTWTLGSAETHEVLVYVTFAERPGIQVSPLRFTAVLDNAGDAGYQNPEHNASVDTVHDALDDLYDAAVRLHYVDGDGQVAARDEWLPRPLVVALSGYQTPAGKSVRFKLDSSNVWGALSLDGVTPAPGGTLDVPVGANGLATCYWRPLDHSGTPGADSTSAEIPAVKAILLDGAVETSRQVTFNAWLSNADRLRFYQSERAKEARNDANPDASVQEALDNLYDNAAILHYVGGDGQSGRVGQPLANKLRVRLGDGTWNTNAATVHFEPAADSGTVDATNPTPDVSGVYECTWTLGSAETHEVLVYVTFAERPGIQVSPLRFTAVLDNSADAGYQNAEHNASVDTVHGALDDLYGAGVRLHYVDGDGQVSARGEWLSRPLVVALSGYQAPAGKSVRFKLDSSNVWGELSLDGATPAPGGPLDVPLGANGLATCYWRPLDHGGTPGADSTTAEIPAVKAILLDGGVETSHQVTFNAWLSNADRVRFYQSERAKAVRNDPSAEASLQEALDNLYDNAAILHFAGGDGQSGRPGQALANKLRVRLGDGTWDTSGATVHFVPAAGSGSVDVPNPTPDTSGIYECTWTLGNSGPQEVRAHVTFSGPPAVEISPIYFTAVFSEPTLPVGTLIVVNSEVQPATLHGFLYCDGTAVSKTEYSELYSVIGDIYAGIGTAPGSGEFNLPLASLPASQYQFIKTR